MQTDRRSLLKGLAAAGLAVSGMGLAQAATVLAGKPAASAADWAKALGQSLTAGQPLTTTAAAGNEARVSFRCVI